MTVRDENEIEIDRESKESIVVDVQGPPAMVMTTWEYSLVLEGTAIRVWEPATLVDGGASSFGLQRIGVRVTLPGTTPPGRYTMYLRGDDGAPTLRVPGSILFS